MIRKFYYCILLININKYGFIYLFIINTFCRVPDNIVTNIDEVYSVGSLGRINEMRDFGNKLHMLIQCFRRIKLTKPLFEDQDIDKSNVYVNMIISLIFLEVKL